MAVPLQEEFPEPLEPATEIIAALAGARTLPWGTLRRAPGRAEEIAPAVIDVAEKAARHVFLTPYQYNLLFWGIHTVAAARRTELHRPLLDLLRRVPEDELRDLLGDVIRRTLKKVLISTFDGDPEPLIAACADKNLDGDLRCQLMLALARLTFDGRIPRATTLAFLDRFEQEALADPDNPAWDGWQDAIIYLGVGEMRGRLRASWSNGRNNFPEQEERDEVERLLSIAEGLAPGDASLFRERGIVPLGNPEEDLEWTTRGAYERDEEIEPAPDDPAGMLALKEFERDWLEQFLRSTKVPSTTMTLEQVDGFFSALIAGPVGARLDDYLGTIWSADKTDSEVPAYDDAEQERYVASLLRRHWATINQRLGEGYVHSPFFVHGRDPWRGRPWAGAFFLGMAMRETEWSLRIREEPIDFFVRIVTGLDMDIVEARETKLRLEFREKLILALPKKLLSLHHAWRGREDPFPPRPGIPPGLKVGRNERCPCGSGKKFKHCCGSPAKRELD